MAPRERETADVAGAARRMIRALGRRAATGDLDALAELDGLDLELGQAMMAGVRGLRDEPNHYSWADIGQALGVTRQAALQRWPNTPGRRPGGQPGHLR